MRTVYTEARNPACRVVTGTPLDFKKCEAQSQEATVLQNTMNTSCGWLRRIASSLSVWGSHNREGRGVGESQQRGEGCGGVTTERGGVWGSHNREGRGVGESQQRWEGCGGVTTERGGGGGGVGESQQRGEGCGGVTTEMGGVWGSHNREGRGVGESQQRWEGFGGVTTERGGV